MVTVNGDKDLSLSQCLEKSLVYDSGSRMKELMRNTVGVLQNVKTLPQKRGRRNKFWS